MDVSTPDNEDIARPVTLLQTEHHNTIKVDENDDLSDAETISVCSEREESNDKQVMGQAVSYFGYEIAHSESSRSSPRLSSEHDESCDQMTPDSASVPNLLQPKVIYCDPRLLYPQLPTAAGTCTPILLPTMLMKQFYTSTTTADSSTQSTVDNHDVVTRPQPLFFSLPSTKSMPTQLTSNSTKRQSEQVHSRQEANNDRQKIHTIQESKSRKCKNGIYIYTNPTAPLQFMSLNSRKHSSSNKSQQQKELSTSNTRKLVAGAPVSPHTGEPVIMKDSGYHLHVVKQASAESDNEKSPNSLNVSLHDRHISPSTSPNRKTAGGSSSTASGGNSKKRRELVFHWYKSPEAPLTKRPKLLDS